MSCSRGGPPMMARIGVMKALNRHVERYSIPSAKKTHWGKAKAEERPMTAFVDVDTSKQVGDPDHVALCATPG